MRLRVMAGTIAVLTMWGASGAFAQNAASNKSFLTHSDKRLTFAPINGTGSSDVVTLPTGAARFCARNAFTI